MDRYDRVKMKAKRAFERRFGASMLPLNITLQHGSKYRNRLHVRVFDPETGSWAQYDAGGTRLRRVDEFDAMN